MNATVYILLFRGVGGATQLPTKPLREALAAAGFANCGTYINSGNAYLKTSLAREDVLAAVTRLCDVHFGFKKDIYAVTLQEWRELVAGNPFPKVTEGRFLHAAILGSSPVSDAIRALKALAAPGEGVEIVGQVAYLHTPGGLSQSRLGVKFDRGLGVPNTARNWNTVLKLLDLGEQAAR